MNPVFSSSAMGPSSPSKADKGNPTALIQNRKRGSFRHIFF
jgi:hypothetical protein